MLAHRDPIPGHACDILVVEDSTTQAEQLKRLLEQQRHQVTIAYSGSEALAHLQHSIPQLVISDIVMPGMDGYALCRAIKSDPRLEHTPVILVTALTEVQDVLKGLECGADNFIRKPYDATYLLSRIDYLLMNRQLRSEQKIQLGMEIYLAGKKHFITADRQQILDLLISTYEEAIRIRQELELRQEQLELLTERLQTRGREIAAKNLQLEETDRMKSEFLANMSHELRTPLNAIIGFSEVLRDEVAGTLNRRQQAYVADILDSGKHLFAVVSDMLDLSKIEAGRMELDNAITDIAELLRNSLGIVRDEALSRRVALKLDVPETLGQLGLDARRMKQTLYNLLSNAVKFTSEDGSITLRARIVGREEAKQTAATQIALSAPLPRTAKQLVISITDTGIGIAKSDISSLFPPFMQTDRSLARRFERTGLGLVMVRKLVELHGGSVGVVSKRGKGSTFTLWLPYRNVAPSVSGERSRQAAG